MTRTYLLGIAATFLVGLSAPLTACADTLTLTLAQAAQTTSSTGVIAYTGTIFAPSTNTSTVFLNGDSFSFGGPYVLDDSPSLDAPFSFNPGSSYTGALFNVEITDPLMMGTFNGTFTLLGGVDAFTQNALASQAFSTTISAPASAVTPEPSPILLLFTGTILFAGVDWHARTTRKSQIT